MLSICITIKNRSKVETGSHILNLFPNCIESIKKSISNDIPLDIVVADWDSDDWPMEEWLRKAAYPVPVQIIRLQGPFSRGKGLNAAAKAAKGKYLFFLDADVLISREVISTGIEYLNRDKVFFPVVYSFDSPEHITGWWRYEGFGNCMVTKSMFNETMGWPEYKAWGKEDNDFYAKIKSYAEIVRESIPGFYHQWHPDDLIWKNRYAEKANEIAHEIKQVEVSKTEIISIIPEGGKFILIDEGRLGGSDCIPGRLEFQFPELDGEYGGPPEDDAAAIKELDRCISIGARYIVIAWTAFWWLEYYPVFNEYLLTHCNIDLVNERLKILSIRKTG